MINDFFLLRSKTIYCLLGLAIGDALSGVIETRFAFCLFGISCSEVIAIAELIYGVH
jgi:hypothetical protein